MNDEKIITEKENITVETKIENSSEEAHLNLSEKNNQSDTETAKNKTQEEKGQFGKFKDADALLSAYITLEAEFTKKCQILAELKSGAKDKVLHSAPQTDYGSEEFIEKNILTNKIVVDRVITEYLKELNKQRAPRTISAAAGYMPLVPPSKPKTIEEAGRMAAQIIGNM